MLYCHMPCHALTIPCTQERHILNQIPQFVQFCREQKLALIAALPLAQGAVLSSKELHHPEMTPAQAALHWNMQQQVAVIPGVDTIEQVRHACTVDTMHCTIPYLRWIQSSK